LPLPLLRDDAPSAPYVDLYKNGAIVPRPCNLQNMAALLELAFGLSASKQYGANQWALRCNPSSGNLHPTEVYVVAQACAGIPDGVHHYLSSEHVLEQRCRFATSPVQQAQTGFLLGLSSIHWREAWKYGERAFRYCQHDVGHAIACARYAAATLGWQARLLSDWSDEAIASLGLDRAQDFVAAEREYPDVMLWVETAGNLPVPQASPAAGACAWTGQANRLSPQHAHDWPVIDAVASVCAKPETHTLIWPESKLAPKLAQPLPSACEARASTIIKQRRSAQAFDGVSSISAATFYRMLDMTLPRAQVPPWDVLAWPPRIHLALFVHRVDGLVPGVYLLLRNAHIEQRMRTSLSDAFEWVRAENCPAHLTLYRLIAADTRDAAKALSCHQEIAADGAFSLGMLAEFESSVADAPWVYRQLFWECGILGQVLYLEAEAAGVRGTGIGCFFDDGVHALLGIEGHWLQSLYHFTVGGGLTDTRLQTFAPYAHLQREKIS
jgi:SagB-type dehydrogenase family enzyme